MLPRAVRENPVRMHGRCLLFEQYQEKKKIKGGTTYELLHTLYMYRNDPRGVPKTNGDGPLHRLTRRPEHTHTQQTNTYLPALTAYHHHDTFEDARLPPPSFSFDDPSTTVTYFLHACNISFKKNKQ